MDRSHASFVRMGCRIVLVACVLLAPLRAWAQAAPPQSRIVEKVDENVLVTLRGNTHPLAQRQFDRGAAPADLPMARMLLVLKHSAAQEAALEKLLDDQQDRNSPSYHQWLTPDQFGQQFGPSDQAIPQNVLVTGSTVITIQEQTSNLTHFANVTVTLQ
jgi:Pro-kumamolisin, activation domain